MVKINVAIDGYSACGKSSTARGVAKGLGYLYLDSGAMYRAVTYYFLENKVSLTNPTEVVRALENIHVEFRVNHSGKGADTFLNGSRVEDRIRSLEVSNYVSTVSAIPAVRQAMVKVQRHLARNRGVVMDGRDIGTVVLPNAELKVFMTADVDVRAERRQKELFEKDQLVNFEEVKRNLIERDRLDTTRKDSPLMRADDAIVLDTTYITLDEQIEEVLNLATAIILRNSNMVLGGS